jgi:hypothetical protein
MTATTVVPRAKLVDRVKRFLATYKIGVSLTLGALLLVLAIPTGCDSISNAIDCDGICSRYASCYDSDYDQSACTSRCRDNAGKDDDYMARADSCNECIGDKSCASATFNCAGECVGIVP